MWGPALASQNAKSESLEGGTSIVFGCYRA